MEVDRPEVALVVVVDDDPEVAMLVSRWLAAAGHQTLLAHDGASARSLLATCAPHLVLVDLDLGDSSGLDLIRWLRQGRPPCAVVMLTASAEVSDVVQAMREGAQEYLVKPVGRTRLLAAVDKALNDSGVRSLRQRTALLDGEKVHGMVGRSPPMLQVHAHLTRLAQSDVTVLIGGETGSGKEVVARAIHSTSARANQPFVAVNCGAIPEGLQESELFGHEKGSFTGATSRRLGRFEQANGGVLFLDEVGELSPQLQVLLLRVLQERKFHRVGGDQEIPVDVRVIAATHRELSDDVEEGRFRADLFYRLAVYELEMPPLRDRGDDIMLLAHHMLEQLSQGNKGPLPRITPEVERILMAHDWPGNVRELRNTIERAIVASGGVIRVEHLPPRLQKVGQQVEEKPKAPPAPPPAQTSAPPPTRTRVRARGQSEEREREAIMAAIAAAGGNVSEAMRILGIPRTTMYRKMRRFGLLDPETRGD